VLFWGIVGAIVLRGLMIATGTALLAHFDWMFYVFGAILLISALRMLRDDDEVPDFGASFPARLVRRFMPVSEELDRARFFVRRDGVLHATPLFVALVMVELTDVVFAVDSIPAILAVTRDPFLVFTSNAFAILGLRSLYFAVAGLMAMFRYLKYSLVLILAFVGMKMLLVSHFHVPNLVSLGIILGTLAGGVVASLWRRGARNGPLAASEGALASRLAQVAVPEAVEKVDREPDRGPHEQPQHVSGGSDTIIPVQISARRCRRTTAPAP